MSTEENRIRELENQIGNLEDRVIDLEFENYWNSKIMNKLLNLLKIDSNDLYNALDEYDYW